MNHSCFLLFIKKMTIFHVKIISKGFEMDSAQIIDIRILIMTMSLIRIKVTNYLCNIAATKQHWWDILSCRFYINCSGNFAWVIQKHCSGKKEFNISAFSLKSVTHLFWWFKVEVKEFFHYLKISSKLTKRFCTVLDLPTYWINRSSIFIYYFQLLNSVGFRDIMFFKY